MSGKPAYTLRRNSRKNKSVLGNVYDPFAPWHVLSIQCFPDWNSSVDAHEHNVSTPAYLYLSGQNLYKLGSSTTIAVD
jgi:hypothetical protein